MSYADSLRQQAKWIRERLQGRGPLHEWEDIDLDELEASANELERLQTIIDSRPAINAGLPETYIHWSQSIYAMEFARARNTEN